ncbi:hypothetical protein MA16_Dca008316 [Dendrobium catenatum]|uniref:Uncharacterized protein n=1 Tax=Dendrobium catenatum TaxID=906689 RepID=A0A2I0W7Z6_9ASPA|nr:hypothetical protein MA16_Dca008316 [Dendrobium catenatum]
MKKELLSSVPWRGEERSENFPNAKLKVTNNSGSMPTMHVPRKSSVAGKADIDDNVAEIDPELRYSFHRNVQVFLLCMLPLSIALVSLTILHMGDQVMFFCSSA